MKWQSCDDHDGNSIIISIDMNGICGRICYKIKVEQLFTATSNNPTFKRQFVLFYFHNK